jgi:hypothetical protein
MPVNSSTWPLWTGRCQKPGVGITDQCRIIRGGVKYSNRRGHEHGTLSSAARIITRLPYWGWVGWPGLPVSRALWLQPSAQSVQGTRRQFLGAQGTPAERQGALRLS